MLTYLHIKNIALVDEIEIDFNKGLTVVTGETGAGKSVIVGSLNFILGERFGTDQIRAGQEKALIEAMFDIAGNKPLKAYLTESDIGYDEREFIVKREVSRDGKGKCFICGSVVALAALKTVGDYLVDIHGQHDHQSLLNPLRHTDILDQFADTGELCGRVRAAYGSYAGLNSKRGEIVAEKENKARELDFLKFQLDEIKKADLKENEDVELQKEFDILRNAARLKEVSSGLCGELYEADESLIGKVGRLESRLTELSKFEPEFEQLVQDLRGAVNSLRGIADAAGGFRDKVDINEERLRDLEDRIVLIERLKKKYGGALEQVIAFRDELAGKVYAIENTDEALAELDKRIKAAVTELENAASALSRKRAQAAKRLSALITKELDLLGMAGTDFKAEIIPVEAGASGAERVEFLISPNKGEALKPMKNIASGGEVSRVMLAVKKVLAEADRIETLIFDEIDVNIGGSVANVVGERLQEVSAAKQVICITHLPQIAGRGDRHLFVEKKAANGRTVTSVREIAGTDRTEEITRMLGGRDDAAAAVEYAKELLKHST
jgi:DNA repair protein RecN (Recombination protein N)